MVRRTNGDTHADVAQVYHAHTTCAQVSLFFEGRPKQVPGPPAPPAQTSRKTLPQPPVLVEPCRAAPSGQLRGSTGMLGAGGKRSFSQPQCFQNAPERKIFGVPASPWQHCSCLKRVFCPRGSPSPTIQSSGASGPQVLLQNPHL